MITRSCSVKEIDYLYLYVTDMVEFTDEEGYGKYLDLHECYEKFVNLKGIEVCESYHVTNEYLSLRIELHV
jgi:hypothetical protein